MELNDKARRMLVDCLNTRIKTYRMMIVMVEEGMAQVDPSEHERMENFIADWANDVGYMESLIMDLQGD